jgi:hypothetical protein
LLGDLFAICDSIFDVQADRILDVLDGLLIGIALAVTALKSRAGNEVALRVRLYDDGKCHISHSQIIGSAVEILPVGFYIVEQSGSTGGLSRKFSNAIVALMPSSSSVDATATTN